MGQSLGGEERSVKRVVKHVEIRQWPWWAIKNVLRVRKRGRKADEEKKGKKEKIEREMSFFAEMMKIHGYRAEKFSFPPLSFFPSLRSNSSSTVSRAFDTRRSENSRPFHPSFSLSSHRKETSRLGFSLPLSFYFSLSLFLSTSLSPSLSLPLSFYFSLSLFLSPSFFLLLSLPLAYLISPNVFLPV